MPIMEDDKGVYVEYSIPDDIKSRIPDYFYYAMAGELVSVFGPDVLKYEEEIDDYYLFSSTTGWGLAFKMTCKKLDMDWLWEYWRTLEWYDSDIFDGEIETEIIERFCKKDHGKDGANCYYDYLLEGYKNGDN